MTRPLRAFDLGPSGMFLEPEPRLTAAGPPAQVQPTVGRRPSRSAPRATRDVGARLRGRRESLRARGARRLGGPRARARARPGRRDLDGPRSARAVGARSGARSTPGRVRRAATSARRLEEPRCVPNERVAQQEVRAPQLVARARFRGAGRARRNPPESAAPRERAPGCTQSGSSMIRPAPEFRAVGDSSDAASRR